MIPCRAPESLCEVLDEPEDSQIPSFVADGCEGQYSDIEAVAVLD
jgi:hypothetical protein